MTTLDGLAFGLRGDGSTDCYGPLRAAVADPRLAYGGVLDLAPGRYRVVMPAYVSEVFRPQSGLTLRGVPGMTTIALESPAVEFKQPIRLADEAVHHVRFEGLAIRRSSAWSGCLVALDAGSDIRFVDCTFDGGMGTLKPPVPFVFGIYYASGSGMLRDVSFERCEFTGCSSAAGSSNQAFGIVHGLSFDGCRFHDNWASDLELNAPNQTLAQEQLNTIPPVRPFLQSMIRIRDCVFEANRSTGPSGYAIGLAHMRDVLIDGCTFNDYWNQAVHVEDYSSAIRILGNRFVGCCLGGDGGAACVITCSRAVSIVGNDFDQSMIANPKAPCISVQPGAATGQFNQCPNPRPTGVVIVGNTLRPGAADPVANLVGDGVTWIR